MWKKENISKIDQILNSTLFLFFSSGLYQTGDGWSSEDTIGLSYQRSQTVVKTETSTKDELFTTDNRIGPLLTKKKKRALWKKKKKKVYERTRTAETKRSSKSDTNFTKPRGALERHPNGLRPHGSGLVVTISPVS